MSKLISCYECLFYYLFSMLFYVKTLAKPTQAPPTYPKFMPADALCICVEPEVHAENI